MVELHTFSNAASNPNFWDSVGILHDIGVKGNTPDIRGMLAKDGAYTPSSSRRTEKFVARREATTAPADPPPTTKQWKLYGM